MMALRLFVVICVSLPLFSSVNPSASRLEHIPTHKIEPLAQLATLEFTYGIASSEVTPASSLAWPECLAARSAT